MTCLCWKRKKKLVNHSVKEKSNMLIQWQTLVHMQITQEYSKMYIGMSFMICVLTEIKSEMTILRQ